MMRRAPQIAKGAHLIGRRSKALQLCATMSGSPNIAQPTPNRSEPDAKLSSGIILDCSIAIDPIKYIRIPFSFYYFKPDSNVINNNRMPSKPSLPFSSIFGFHSHFVILSFGLRMKRTEVARVWDRRDQIMSWIFSRSSLLIQRREHALSAATVAASYPQRRRRAIASAWWARSMTRREPPSNTGLRFATVSLALGG
jgi:hypothetical protein